ncbi:hypothetical protein HNP02_003509 [Mycobacterium sp. AZCC_0083]|nr:hypothetical protein [Mycobacterium sp. AZCC_0083]
MSRPTTAALSEQANDVTQQIAAQCLMLVGK